MSSAGDSPSDDPPFDLDFRSCVDDAWYTARVLLNGDTLTVKLQDFPQPTSDEVFHSGDFSTPEAVDDFRLRFRPYSHPLEDSECARAVEGTKICATFKEDGQVRFFDAIVDAVKSVQHSSDKCTCTFFLYWEQGPEEGNVTPTSIADICLLSHGKLDSKVYRFINLAKENIRADSQRSNSDSSEISLSKGLARDTRKSYLLAKSKSSSSGRKLQTGRYYRQSDQDEDMGGVKERGDHHYCYKIIIENLEKDLSPSSVIEFIHKHTSVAPQVYVFPSLSSETYTRGAIILDCKRKMMKIYEFLNNPNHSIVSLTGRPWVIAESVQRTETPKKTFGSSLPTQYISVNKDNDIKLKVVHSGTEEYTRTKELSVLFDEFRNHLKKLRKRLAVEEKKLLLPSNAV